MELGLFGKKRENKCVLACAILCKFGTNRGWD